MGPSEGIVLGLEDSLGLMDTLGMAEGALFTLGAGLGRHSSSRCASGRKAWTGRRRSSRKRTCLAGRRTRPSSLGGQRCENCRRSLHHKRRDSSRGPHIMGRMDTILADRSGSNYESTVGKALQVDIFPQNWNESFLPQKH
jgi:hypothetical protein